MKTHASKITSTALQLQKGNQPFFKKEEEGAFFSQDSVQLKANEFQTASPFFGNRSGSIPFSTPTAIQSKPAKTAGRLTIGQPGDKYEQEADAMADQVVQRLAVDRSPLSVASSAPGVQRECAECAGEDKEQALAPKLQPKAIFESNEEQPLQKKCAVCQEKSIQPKRIQMQGGPSAASPDLESRLSSSKGGGSPLPKDTRGSMESAFGADFSGVRVHTDSGSVQMNQELGAQAFTHGSDVYFNQGKYDTGSGDGQRLLAHELTHVVQQGGSGLMPKLQRKYNGIPSIQLATADQLDYITIARQIHEAISGLGTDEEGVYSALQRLNRDATAISRLKTKYKTEYGEELEDAIRGDFSGSELDYALGLINAGGAGTAREIGAAPSTTAEWEAAAKRIRDAVEGAGTDEEAIFAVLVPLNLDPHLIEQLSNTYFTKYSETLLDRLRSEMSGSELGYALYLMRAAPSPTQAEAADSAAGMVGSQMTWTPSGPGSGNTFESWASAPTEGAAPPVSSGTTINCWEMVILAAYQRNLVSWQWIHDIYTASAPNWGDYLVQALSGSATVTYTIGAPATPVPIRGDIVFFDGAAHVAMATGEQDALGRTKVYSFWPPPGTAFVPGGTLDDVKVTTIEELDDYWQTVAGRPAFTITFSSAPW